MSWGGETEDPAGAGYAGTEYEQPGPGYDQGYQAGTGQYGADDRGQDAGTYAAEPGDEPAPLVDAGTYQDGPSWLIDTQSWTLPTAQEPFSFRRRLGPVLRWGVVATLVASVVDRPVTALVAVAGLAVVATRMRNELNPLKRRQFGHYTKRLQKLAVSIAEADKRLRAERAQLESATRRAAAAAGQGMRQTVDPRETLVGVPVTPGAAGARRGGQGEPGLGHQGPAVDVVPKGPGAMTRVGRAIVKQSRTMRINTVAWQVRHLASEGVGRPTDARTVHYAEGPDVQITAGKKPTAYVLPSL